MNDSGFFAEFKINDEKEEYKLFDKTFQIGDVSVDDNDDYHDNLGFLLFVKDGYLEFLDVYFMNLPKDYDVSNIKLVYDQNPRIINF